nr:fasciclin domain-containing protein [Anaerolineales bacterium]
MRSRFIVSSFLLLAVVLGACTAATPEPTQEPAPAVEVEAPEPTEMPEPEPQDIVDIAVADGRFETLVAAVQAAGLVDALKGEGPLTVFAPTDEAFAALPEGT